MKLGIDRLLNQASLRSKLRNQRLALVAHPASVTSTMTHSLDALMGCSDLKITAAFGPQHGLRGEKQDNMLESKDYVEPFHKIPVFSLYGEVRRPTNPMMDTFDVLLFDIQDLGCRIYTYVTTLLYLLEACSRSNKSIWILDRPNPAGRSIEGTLRQPGWESFVGAGEIIMRHGLTMGEIARWFVKNHAISVDLNVVEMEDYQPSAGPGFGWPTNELSWVNPSPNASSLNMARIYAGSVLLEGTTLSEGRGTTVALEIMGAPDLDTNQVMECMANIAPEWMLGSKLRPCYFQPTFHKHEGKLCQGIQIHTDNADYNPDLFKPFRVVILYLKAIKTIYPHYNLWRDFHYEYEKDRLAFDVINGGTTVREWIDNPDAIQQDIDAELLNDESTWATSINPFLCY